MKKTFWWGVGFLIVIGLIFYVSLKPGKLDDFAKCLTEKGAIMYGAYWCPHCQEQKALFGKSWNFVNYVECSLPNAAGQTQECLEKEIKSYPVWEFSDENRVSSALGLEQLAGFTGCQLPSA